MSSSVAFFHAAGYLRIPELITANQVGALNDVTGRIVKGLDLSPGSRARIDRAVSADPAYLMVAASDRVVSALRPILGPDVELVENRHNHVSVYSMESVDRLHRDVLQWSRSILTVWVYLSDCTQTAAATGRTQLQRRNRNRTPRVGLHSQSCSVKCAGQVVPSNSP